MNFLSKIGTDAKKVFDWIASAKGQKVVQEGEAIVETGVAIAAPALAPEIDAAITLANNWMEKAITVETVAASAGLQNGTGVQKAAAVISAVNPYIAQYEQAAGASPLTAAQTKAANEAIVAFLNALSPAGSAIPAVA